MAAAGLTIPLNSNTDKQVLEVVTNINDMLFVQLKKSQKKQAEQIKIERDNQILAIQREKREKENESKEKNRITLRDRIYKQYDKWIVKGAFFKKLGTSLTNISKGIANFAKNNWFTMLMGLLMIMLFDPEGKFLLSILDFIISMALMLINVIAKYIPKLIQTAIFIITKVLPEALRRIVSALFPAIGKMFTDWAEMLKKDYPVISWIFETIGNAFKKDGAIYKFGMWLANNIVPIAIGIGLVQAAIWAYTIAMKMQSIAAWLAVPANIALASTIMIWVGAILVLIGIFYLIYKYSDKITLFFESLWNWFKNLGIVGKILLIPLLLIIAPLIKFGLLIYGLAKLFSSFKKIGIANTFKALGTGIANIASSAKDWFASTSVGKAVGGAVSTVKEYGGKAIDWVMQKLSSFATWLSKFLDVLKDIGQWFSIISSDPINFFLGRLNKTAMKKYLEYQSAIEGKVSFSPAEKEKLYKEGKTTEAVAVMEGTASLKQFEEYLKQQDKDGKQFISLSGEMVKILDKIEKKGGGQKTQTNATVIEFFNKKRG
jgi:hypothetical protein